ncbi:hypothetical protein BD770DRAFT_396975 [Pilaira anomala]|nr:hypothetical protein BD770DRAFT_396975 [Pilaira anomala]
MGKQQPKEEEEEYEVEYINSHKLIGNKNKKKLLFEIKWKGYSADENTWESSESVDNAKELVDKYWSTKGGKQERIRVEKILKGENLEEKKEKEVLTVDETPEVDIDAPRKTRSNKSIAPVPAATGGTKKKTPPSTTAKNDTQTKKRKIETVEYSTDSDDDEDYSESEIKDENFRMKNSWKEAAKVIVVRTVSNGDKDELYGLVRWRDGKLALYKTSVIAKKIPEKLIKYYEKKLIFEHKPKK